MTCQFLSLMWWSANTYCPRFFKNCCWMLLTLGSPGETKKCHWAIFLAKKQQVFLNSLIKLYVPRTKRLLSEVDWWHFMPYKIQRNPYNKACLKITCILLVIQNLKLKEPSEITQNNFKISFQKWQFNTRPDVLNCKYRPNILQFLPGSF